MALLKVFFNYLPGVTQYTVSYGKQGGGIFEELIVDASPAMVEVEDGFSYEGTVKGDCADAASFLALYPYRYCNETTVVDTAYEPDEHTYPPVYYAVANTASTIVNMVWLTNQRPYIFNVYRPDNTLAATTGWVGVADYEGPWGASLNTPQSGSLPWNKEENTFFRIEVISGPHPTVNDSFLYRIECENNTFRPTGVSLSYEVFTSTTETCLSDVSEFRTVYSETGTYVAGSALYGDAGGLSILADGFYKREDGAYLQIFNGTISQIGRNCGTATLNGCLFPGTQITMLDGSHRPVEAVRAGDDLQTMRLVQLENGLSDEESLSWFSHNITLQPAGTKVILAEAVQVEGTYNFNDVLYTSADHIHFVYDGEKYLFCKSPDVKLNHCFIDRYGDRVPLTKIEYRAGVQQMFRLDTEPVDVYLANSFITHNKSGDL